MKIQYWSDNDNVFIILFIIIKNEIKGGLYMSLIYTEGYLESMEISSLVKDLPKDIQDILIIPPANNDKDIIFYIYEYDKYHSIYEIHLLKNPVHLEGSFLKDDTSYSIKTNTQTSVQLFYKRRFKE